MPNEAVLKKFEIMRDLSRMPEERLQEVFSFIKFVLSQGDQTGKTSRKEPKTLAGIWKGKGFENIPDIDKEIANLRKELDHQILERHK